MEKQEAIYFIFMLLTIVIHFINTIYNFKREHKAFFVIRIIILGLLIGSIVAYWNIVKSEDEVKNKNGFTLGLIYSLYSFTLSWYIYRLYLLYKNSKNKPIEPRESYPKLMPERK